MIRSSLSKVIVTILNVIYFNETLWKPSIMKPRSLLLPTLPQHVLWKTIFSIYVGFLTNPSACVKQGYSISWQTSISAPDCLKQTSPRSILDFSVPSDDWSTKLENRNDIVMYVLNVTLIVNHFPTGWCFDHWSTSARHCIWRKNDSYLVLITRKQWKLLHREWRGQDKSLLTI